MRRIVAVAVFVLGALAVMGSGGGTYQGGSYGSRGASYQAGGVAGVDTVRILSRNSKFPNSAAITAGYVEADSSYYTHLNKGRVGEAVRWGYHFANQPTTVQFVTTANSDYRIRVQCTQPEDNFAWQSTAYNSFIWVSCNGLKPGMEVRSASLIFNIASFANPTIPATAYIAARLDTIPADYNMLNGRTVGAAYSSCNDTSRFAVTWANVDNDHTTAWAPTMATRLDRHDFGPRSADTIGPGAYTQGQCLKLDVADAVQQACDNAMSDPTVLTRGLLFLVYGVTAGTEVTVDINAGNYAGVGSLGKGAPVFVCEATTRRGAKSWDTGDVPVIMTCDDDLDAHVGYAGAMWAAGLKFTAANYHSGFINNASMDSLLSPNLARVELLHHSLNHPYIGALTGSDLNDQIERADYYSDTFWTTAPDSDAVQHYAWPVASGAGQVYGFPAISRMIDYGYLSCRAPGTKANAVSPIGDVEYLSWTRPSNMFAIGSVFASSIFTDWNLSGAVDSLDVREKILDYIDDAYTNGDKGALVIYAHKWSDGVTPTLLTDLIEIVNQLDCASMMSYSEMVAMRLSGSTFLDPGDITAANGYTASEELTAARTDSAMTANTDLNYLQVWISGK